jgi:Domain of unknown function (DUF4337)
MSETIDRAHETIHEAGHAHAGGDAWARVVAIMVAALAAMLALSEIGAKSSQTHYLTDHIALSDNWAFYQSKHERAVTRESEAALLGSLPNAADPAVQARITAAQTYARRMRDDPASGDGMAQLEHRAKDLEQERNKAFRRYHRYEYTSGALEIAIVLASVSLVTRVRALTMVAGVTGLLAGLYALAIACELA